MKILSERETIHITEYFRRFKFADSYSEFFFPSDKDGNVDDTKLNVDANKNYQSCLMGSYIYSDGHSVQLDDCGVYIHNKTYTEPAIGECDYCSTEVILDRFTNTCCDCGVDYNGSGQELASREQWGEETGESIQDILSIDSQVLEELFES